MVKLAVMYKAPEDPEAFEKRYIEGHLPLVQSYANIKETSFAKVTRNVMGSADYAYIFTGVWTDWDALKADLNSEQAKSAGEDAKTFAPAFDVIVLEELI